MRVSAASVSKDLFMSLEISVDNLSFFQQMQLRIEIENYACSLGLLLKQINYFLNQCISIQKPWVSFMKHEQNKFMWESFVKPFLHKL